MQLLRAIVFFGFILSFLLLSNSEISQAQTTGPCGLTGAAFCETFDTPANIGNRSGQLDGTLWGVSREGSTQNFGQPDAWSVTQQSVCGTIQTFKPDNDVYICNGQLVEGFNDLGNVATLAMYPKQPFDFAGRTGKVVFDVSNDSEGNHSAWPEFWITDKPVPAPFTHEGTYISQPANGLGIRFAGFAGGNGQATTCPEGDGYLGIDSAVIVRNYVISDTFNGANIGLSGNDCVKKSSGPGQFNHYEIDISQNQIDIYGTDAGTVSPLKHLSKIPNANLSLTRGLIWVEEAHYNGDKFGNQGTHEFSWDNVGFDGPLLPRDLAYDVNDNVVGSGSQVTLGWGVNANTTHSFIFNNVVNPTQAVGALLTFNYWAESAPFSFGYSVNGHSYSFPWPYADNVSFSPRTIGIPLNLADLQVGTNTIGVTPTASLNIFNVDLIMQAAGGIIPPGGGIPSTATATTIPTATELPPTATATAIPPTATLIPPTATLVLTNTPVPSTLTPNPIITCQVVVVINGQQTTVDKPVSFCQPSS